ncbi:MAG: ABC transporter ATP-binding protein [Planctomycetota bacterium]
MQDPQAQPSPSGEAATADRLVELIGVHKIYALGETTVRALEGVELSISRGEFVAIVGRSGSGKSTLLNVLGGLDQPTSGQVLIDGTPLRGRRSDELAAYRRRTVGFIFQSFNLVSHLTALENVALPLRLAGALGASARKQRAGELLARVGLAERAGHRPAELSGGERQRVAIARSLANDPSLLLADEPTGNLDSRTAATIMGMIRSLHEEEGRTVVLVTHDREQAERYCQRVIEMADGKVQRDRPARGGSKAAAAAEVGASEGPLDEGPGDEGPGDEGPADGLGGAA